MIAIIYDFHLRIALKLDVIISLKITIQTGEAEVTGRELTALQEDVPNWRHLTYTNACGTQQVAGSLTSILLHGGSIWICSL